LHGFQGFIGVAGAALSRFAPALDAIIGLDPDNEGPAVVKVAGGATLDFFYR